MATSLVSRLSLSEPEYDVGCGLCDHVVPLSLPPELGKVEDKIFKNRRQRDVEFRRRNREKRRRTQVRQQDSRTLS